MIDKIIYSILFIGLISDVILNFRTTKSKIIKGAFIAKSIILQLVAVAILVVWRKDIDMFIVGWVAMIYFTIYLPQSIYTILTIPIKNPNYRSVVAVITSILSATMIYGITIGTNSSRIENVDITSDRLPKSLDKLRIVHITDLHLKGQNPDSRFLRRVVEKINNINPDIVAVTGDFVTYKGEEFKDFEKLLSGIKSKYGVYGVLGNHDYCIYHKWESREDAVKSQNQLLESLERIDWEILLNQNKQVAINGDTINIIGVEHLGGEYPQGSIKKAIQNIDTTRFNLLLSHTPETWDREIVNSYPIDLTLSGHTHAMQLKIKLFGKQYSPSSLIFKQWSGLYREEDRYLYVSDGIGYTGIPMRLGALPEISVITIHSGEDN